VESLNDCSAQDGVSTIGFDSPTCRIPNGQPVDVRVVEQTCQSSTGAHAVITEVDIVLNELLNWNADVETAGVDQWDFETILVHALGRAIGIAPNRNSASVMTEATLRIGVTKRVLDAASDSAAGIAILQDATSGPLCGMPAIVSLPSGTCSISAPLAVFTTSTSTGCGSLAVRFSTTSPYVATSIQWDFDNDGIWDATSSNVEHFYGSPGQYSVRLRVSNAFGVDERLATNIISVYQRPRADAGSDQTVCHGSLVTLGGASTASGTLGPYSIRWSPGRLLSDSTVANPTVRVDGAMSFVVKVTDARGCSSSDTISISTNDAPVVRLQGDTIVCKGQVATVRANIISGFPPFQFVWSGHTNIVGATTQAPRFQPSESTILTLQVTDARGCSTTERIAVKVSQPTTPVIRAPRGTFACQGASLPITVIDDSASEIEWNTGQRGASIDVNQTGTYSARSKNVAGCWSEWQSMHVTIGKAPLPEIAGRPALCNGASTELTAIGDYEAYRWSQGDTTASVTIVRPGRYVVRALHKTGCWSDDVAIDVVAGEQPDKPIIERTGLTLRAVGGNAWQWYRNQQMINGATDAILHVTESGIYAVASISSAGCEERSDEVDVTILSVHNTLEESASPAIVPNPASTQVAISWSYDDIVAISLRDYIGRVVAWTMVPEGSMQCALPLVMIPSGQYRVCFADQYGRLIAPSRPLIVVR
jgi:PKD repeat protein